MFYWLCHDLLREQGDKRKGERVWEEKGDTVCKWNARIKEVKKKAETLEETRKKQTNKQ